MSYLMQIEFDNTMFFWKNIFYFEYKDKKFKFIQNKRSKWSNILITIIKGRMQNNSVEENRTYDIASEYLSALAWEHNSIIKVWRSDNYGMGIPEDIRLSNKKVRRVFFRSVKSLYNHGYGYNSDFQRIPKVENEEQRNALILYREARSTNNDYLSFLFFWQVLEIRHKGGPANWINKTWRNNQSKIKDSIKYDVEKISMGSKKIGEYLYQDCRTAISHLYTLKREGVKNIKIDSLDDNIRFMRGRRIIQEFAQIFIKNELNLQNRLFLVRKGKNDFPVYLDEKYYNKRVDNNFYREAHTYKSKFLK